MALLRPLPIKRPAITRPFVQRLGSTVVLFTEREIHPFFDTLENQLWRSLGRHPPSSCCGSPVDNVGFTYPMDGTTIGLCKIGFSANYLGVSMVTCFLKIIRVASTNCI